MLVENEKHEDTSLIVLIQIQALFLTWKDFARFETLKNNKYTVLLIYPSKFVLCIKSN